MKHYGILEEENLITYLVIQSIVVVNVIIMMVDAIMTVKRTCTSGFINRMLVLEGITDVLCGGLVVAYIILQFPGQIQSASQVKRVLGSVDDIPWGSASVQLDEKKDNFVVSLQELLDSIAWSDTLDIISNSIMLVNLLRVIMCTSVHPRLALLTGN